MNLSWVQRDRNIWRWRSVVKIIEFGRDWLLKHDLSKLLATTFKFVTSRAWRPQCFVTPLIFRLCCFTLGPEKLWSLLYFYQLQSSLRSPKSMKILLDEITFKTYDRPALRNSLQNLFIGLWSWICELYGPKTAGTRSKGFSQDEPEFCQILNWVIEAFRAW